MVRMPEIDRLRVRLRNDVDPAIYGDYACVGNEGWITGVREDSFGLPEVRVEWDKNHWAYNGIQDSWTFPDHFEIIEDDMADNNQINELAQQFVGKLTEAFAQLTQPPAPEPEVKKPRSNLSAILEPLMRGQQANERQIPPEEAQMQSAVQDAMQHLENSAGFILLGVELKEHPTKGDVLEPFVVGGAISPEAEMFTQYHLAGINARSHQDLALQALMATDEQ